jgi:predicted alpha/beta superfamily hydrolase
MFINFKCDLISDTGKGAVVVYVTGPFAVHETKSIYDRVRKITGGHDFVLCEVLVDDWDRLLTPWKVTDCIKGREFGGLASVVLEEIRQELIPLLNERYPEREIYIAGYSLAGLFALWTAYETDLFRGVVSCSGSLWYPGWEEYIKTHSMNTETRVYLSLGKKEEKTKNPVMRSVGEMTRRQYEILKKENGGKHITLEWNEGGHFADTAGRMAKGIADMLYNSTVIM